MLQEYQEKTCLLKFNYTYITVTIKVIMRNCIIIAIKFEYRKVRKLYNSKYI